MSTAQEIRSHDGPEAGDVSLLRVLSSLLRRRLQIATAGLFFAGLVGGLTLSTSRTYTSTAKFMSQSRVRAPSLAGLATQLGISVPTSGDGTQTPQFYADLLRSRDILDIIVQDTVSSRSQDGGVAPILADLLAGDVPSGRIRIEVAVSRLRDAIIASAGQRTGVIEFSVTLESASLASSVAEHLLEETDRFNLITRQSQARAEREFTGKRLQEVTEQLRDSETRLQQFLSGNRGFRATSSLSLVQSKIEREIAVRRQLYQTLSQAYEQARIEEVRDTPVLTIVEKPSDPVRANSRGLAVRLVLAFVVGVLLASLPVLLGVFLSSELSDRSAQLEFQAVRREAWMDLTRPWRLFGRVAARLGRRA